MAKRIISQKIQLDGSKEIRDQLDDIKASGEGAMEAIADAINEVDLSTLQGSLSAFANDLASVGKRVATAFALIGTAAAAASAAALQLAKAGSEAAAEAGEQATRLGLTVEAYGALSTAATEAGVAVGDLESGLSTLNAKIASELNKTAKASEKAGDRIKDGMVLPLETFEDIGVTVRRFGDNVADLDPKARKASGGFAELGIALRDNNGAVRSNVEILKDLADRIAAMPRGPERLALAIQKLGQSAGPKLLPFLELGRDGIETYYDDAIAAGRGFTDEQVKIGKDFRAAISGFGDAVQSTRDQVGLIFAPVFSDLAREFAGEIDRNRQAIVDFGRTVAIFGVGVARDLVNALSGRGADVSRPWINDWRDAVVTFGQDVRAVLDNVVLPTFRLLREAAHQVAEAINAIFGTDISAGQLVLGAGLLKLMGVFTLLTSTVNVAFRALVLFGQGLFALATSTVALTFFTTLRTAALGFAAVVAGVVSWPALLIAGLATAAVAAVLFWDELRAGAGAAFAFISGQVSGLWTEIVAGFEEARGLLVEAFAGVVEDLSGIGADIGNAIAAGFEAGVNRIRTIFAEMVSFISTGVANLFGVIDRLIARISAAIARLRSLFSRQAEESSGFSEGGAVGFARGGHLAHGPGTSTSDSIPALLSRGEYVVRAKAVDQYGPGLFEALNAGLLPKDLLQSFLRMRSSFRRLADLGLDVPRFNMGGIVDGLTRGLTVPPLRLAAGGMALAPSRPGRSITPINLNIDGVGIGSINAVADAALDKLQRELRSRSIRSAGRRPGWSA